MSSIQAGASFQFGNTTSTLPEGVTPTENVSFTVIKRSDGSVQSSANKTITELKVSGLVLTGLEYGQIYDVTARHLASNGSFMMTRVTAFTTPAAPPPAEPTPNEHTYETILTMGFSPSVTP